ncbi:MAG: hypothetical protein UT24_C0004G0075 [Candidatus Woesebacteria bacterium GW2011_GWB1_39_12]|uniref:Uncharacterized protein n=2 Tax=Candidatus Woeseibacteriota TaxID=1752722 RepID=A0A0G0M5F4_9BACT|nr:MAG: hypothetical protein UT23_C0003G0079 [Candidatus Woesebacteria bacterium GW2011_GWA1_39_12]KKR01512.1 MAG: hypothetical protein UT24_C0004G0075 [Candidatus Woesebacteria bacterium GW2011_GWB1_39_12]
METTNTLSDVKELTSDEILKNVVGKFESFKNYYLKDDIESNQKGFRLRGEEDAVNRALEQTLGRSSNLNSCNFPKEEEEMRDVCKLVINHFSENNPQALKIFTNTHRSSYKYEFILDPRIIELVELAIIKIDEIEKKES